MNYRKQIKELSADMDVSYKELIALAPQNDPFYCGSKAQRRDAAWFADIWQRAGFGGGVHLRRVHYWIVSQSEPVQMPVKKKGSRDYRNTDACWRYLTQAAKYARYLGLVAIRDIADHKNPSPHIGAYYNEWDPYAAVEVPDLDEPEVRVGGNGLDVVNAQPYHLEVWCEKSTMDDVLWPACERYKANLVTFEGEVSITACHELIARIEASGGKPARVFYISDFDPAGNSMPAAMSRKVEYLLTQRGLDYDVKITPLALTLEQVKEYRLPRAPIKDSELRAGAFEEAFGAGATELDALEAQHPGVLGQLTRDALATYYSQAAASAVYKQRQALRQAINAKVKAITSRYADEIAALEAMQEELRAIEIDATEYAVDCYPANVAENGAWLFDSARDYVDQIAHYKAHKGGDTE